MFYLKIFVETESSSAEDLFPNVIEEKSGCAMWIDFSDDPGRRTVNSDTFVVQTRLTFYKMFAY